MMFLSRSTKITGYVLLAMAVMAQSRPLVRHIRSASEFDKVLAKHATDTGLPIIADFYSDGCGPCRMMAPIFKKVAKEYQDKAVFVKVDTNQIYEISSRYNVRSLPTFIFFSNGKKTKEFSGASEQQLRMFTDGVVDKSRRENVKLTKDSLIEFYKKMGEDKSVESIEGVLQKCLDLVNKGLLKKQRSEECVGAPAANLARSLKKKYKQAPEMEKRFQPEEKKEEETKKEETKKPEGKAKVDNSKPNLQLATLEELQAELEKRMEVLMEEQLEDETDDDDEFEHAFTPGDFPERVAIIGGGPAGMSAAIYAARAGLTPVIIAPPMGGQLQGKGVEVENYPGMRDVTGPAVISAMRDQAATFGTKFELETVSSVDTSVRPFTIHTNSSTIHTHSIIIATGAEAKWLSIPGEYELRGGGVSSCATCDGAAFYGRDVFVVGGGDTAMEDALVLARTSKSVTVVHRRDQFRASAILAQRVMEHQKISIRWNATVKEILGRVMEDSDASTESGEDEEDLDLDTMEDQKMEVAGIILTDTVTGEESRLDCSAVFVAIGHEPATNFLDGVVEYDPELPKGYLKTLSGSTKTSIPGIFAAGDVTDSVYRQAVTSAGSGAAAALDAERWLSEEGLGNEAAEFEAELLAELMAEGQGSDSNAGFNAYDDAGGKMEGMKESLAAEVPEAEASASSSSEL